MAKKCKCPPPGAPDWVVTYGDMMTLLLCFFVILVALSEIKKEDQYRAVVAEIQKAFGMKGGGGRSESQDDPERSMIPRLDAHQLQRSRSTEIASSDDPGVEGKDPTVTHIREGARHLVGGRIVFEPGSARLDAQARRGLLQAAEQLRGFNTRIEVSGHAASVEVTASGDATDLWTLSFARAKSVMDFLTGEAGGIREERIRLIANADREPIRRKVWTPQTQTPNRRVEVYVIETLVEDYTRPEAP